MKKSKKGRQTVPPSPKTALDSGTAKDYHFARLGVRQRFAKAKNPANINNATDARTKGRFGRPI